MTEYKACKTCLQVKSIDSFYRQRDKRVAHCKDCMKQTLKDRYAKNAETLRQKARDYRKNNPEKVREAKRKWKQANSEKNVASVVAYQRRNPDKHAAAAKKYRQKNKELYSSWARARIAKKKAAQTFIVTNKELNKLYAQPCAHCGSTKNQTIDHIIPIDLGGSHGIGNLQTLCLSCNSSKRNRVMTVWKKSLRGV